MIELAQAKRRIRQLEKCLEDVRRLLFERAVDLNAGGRDRDDNPEYQLLRRAHIRIHRTLRKPGAGEDSP